MGGFTFCTVTKIQRSSPKRGLLFTTAHVVCPGLHKDHRNRYTFHPNCCYRLSLPLATDDLELVKWLSHVLGNPVYDLCVINFQQRRRIPCKISALVLGVRRRFLPAGETGNRYGV